MNSEPRFSFMVAADHPCLPGHFPGNPIVPGVMILDEVTQQLRLRHPHRRIVKIVQTKFLGLLKPDEICEIHFYETASDLIKFVCSTQTRIIANGIAQLGITL